MHPEMRCCSCGTSAKEVGLAGVVITPVRATHGPKSGRPVPLPDEFPDSARSKYICMDCLLPTDLARKLGYYDQGYDTPPEEEVMDAWGMPSMQTALP